MHQYSFEKPIRLSASTIHEVMGQKGAFPSIIKQIIPGLKIFGPAFTVNCPPLNNIWLHKAIYEAAPGDVLVVDTGDREAGYWGEIMTAAAVNRKLGGLVINGCVRDFNSLLKSGFPIFAIGLCIQGTNKENNSKGYINKEIKIGNAAVNPGDIIVGDSDGVVVIPENIMQEVIKKGNERETKELEIIRQLNKGASTLEIYNFDLN